MNNPAIKLTAVVPASFQKQGICWLVLEHDAQDTGGWCLYGHISLDTPCEFDGWYETREQAESEALRQWGVGKDAWTDAPSLRR